MHALLSVLAVVVSCRMMDAAEYVLCDEGRMALADLALDQLSDAVTDDGILHMIASLDAAADVQLMLNTVQVRPEVAAIMGSTHSLHVHCCQPVWHVGAVLQYSCTARHV